MDILKKDLNTVSAKELSEFCENTGAEVVVKNGVIKMLIIPAKNSISRKA